MFQFTSKVKMTYIHKNYDIICIESYPASPPTTKEGTRLVAQEVKEQSKFKVENTSLRRFLSREKNDSNKQNIRTEISISSKILERTKFNNQKLKPKSQFISQGSPHKFHRSLDCNTSNLEEDPTIEFSTRYFDDLNRVLHKNEGHRSNIHLNEICFENLHTTSTPTDTSAPYEMPSQNRGNKTNFNFSLDSAVDSRTLHQNQKEDNWFIFDCDDTQKQILPCCHQHKSACKNLDLPLKKDNNMRKVNLLINKGPVVLGKEKSYAINLMQGGRFKESYDILWNILQKEKQSMHQNSSRAIHLEIAKSYFYIGLLQDFLDNPKISFVYLNESLIIRQKNLKVNHMDIAWTLYFLGIVKGKIGDFKGAIFDLDTCSSIQRSNGFQHMNTSILLRKYRKLLLRAPAA